MITDTQIRKEDESHTRYTLTLKLNKDITKDMLHNLLAQNEEILSVKMCLTAFFPIDLFRKK